MALGDPINVRLDSAVRAVLERQAAAAGVPFSVHLRELLSAGAVADVPAAADGGPSSAMLAEALLLLRDASGQERVRRAQAEIKRQGMMPWQPGERDGK